MSHYAPIPGKVPLAGKGCYPAGPVRKKVQPIVPTQLLESQQLVEKSESFPVGEMPYQLKVRRLVEQKLRSPHRGFLPMDLKRVTAHWVHMSKGSIPWKDNTDVIVNSRSGGIQLYEHPIQNQKDDSQIINVRALIVPGMGETEHCITRSLVRSIHLTAAGTINNTVFTYGGLVRSGTDTELSAELIKLVKEQSGADLSNAHWKKLVEFTYSSGPSTVFFTPIITEGTPPVFSPQMTTDGDGVETYHVTPLRFTLGSLLDNTIHSDTPRDTIEFCMAADSLDEWGRRDMAHQILKILRVRKHEAIRKSEIDRAEKDRIGTTKRRREDEETERKLKRQQRDLIIRNKWSNTDEGKTDEEKRTAMRQRHGVLKDMRDADQVEDDELTKKWESEDEKTTSKAPQQITVQELQPEYLEAFRYFDRNEEGSITRLRLHNILLCVDEELTLKEVVDLLDIPQLPRKQAHLPYRKLALLSKIVDASTAQKPQRESEEEEQPEETSQSVPTV